MFHHQIYAQINKSKVVNMIVCANYEIANELTRKQYGKNAIAIECTYWDCDIGDTYKNNTFYDSEGKERNYKGNEVENIEKLELENEQLKKQTNEDNEVILDHEFRLMELGG